MSDEALTLVTSNPSCRGSLEVVQLVGCLFTYLGALQAVEYLITVTHSIDYETGQHCKLLETVVRNIFFYRNFNFENSRIPLLAPQ